MAPAFFKGGKGSITEGNSKFEAQSTKSEEKHQMIITGTKKIKSEARSAKPEGYQASGIKIKK